MTREEFERELTEEVRETSISRPGTREFNAVMELMLALFDKGAIEVSRSSRGLQWSPRPHFDATIAVELGKLESAARDHARSIATMLHFGTFSKGMVS